VKLRIFLLAIVIVFIPSCSVEDGAAQPVSNGGTESKSSAAPGAAENQDLPFENKFPNRWNASNDGTPFEPCVAFSEEELSRFEIDAAVVEDAAQVDGQGVRGCMWFMPDLFSIGVVVTDADSLAQYKLGMPEIDWKSDVNLGGRVVGMAVLNDDETACMTYVESLESIVVIDVGIVGGSEVRSQHDPCRIAVDFMASNLEKIPA